ncbi:MAG TPA: DHA2 family efflux MFS transporter permease subunit [Actinomycetes bacterium]|nr:DHA2 family efflux MFS transporter permease subunit [Actinomycetes bacterium]
MSTDAAVPTVRGESPGVRFATAQGRWVLLACVLGSGVAFLDATIVNVALPAIGADFHTGLASLQWIVNAYTLTLSGLLLLGGSLGDRLGRRRIFVVGVVWFALASVLCGAALNAPMLIAARALQGVGAALLTPGSLAIIEAVYVEEDRARAVGAWSGLGGAATAIGPFLGGWLIDAVSWRLAFLINLPLAAVVVWVALRHIPETRDPHAADRLDWTGATLAALGLAGVIYALTEGPGLGWTSPVILVTGLGGLLMLAAFVVVERTSSHPMLPLEMFASRQFTGANLVTFVVYGALGGATFLLPIQLQRVLGYSALESGVAFLPITVILLLLSARAGALAQRVGPRLPMTLGPIVVAIGFLLLGRIGPGSTYLTDVLPALIVFGLGLALTVAPLTATVLAAASAERAGIASAINNDVARVAGLIAVAALPVAAGLSGAEALEPAVFSDGFRTATTIAATLCALGGLLAFATIRRPAPVAKPAGAAEEAPCFHCRLDAPPQRVQGAARAASPN